MIFSKKPVLQVKFGEKLRERIKILDTNSGLQDSSDTVLIGGSRLGDLYINKSDLSGLSITGCDGSGKTTLAHKICASIMDGGDGFLYVSGKGYLSEMYEFRRHVERAGKLSEFVFIDIQSSQDGSVQFQSSHIKEIFGSKKIVFINIHGLEMNVDEFKKTSDLLINALLSCREELMDKKSFMVLDEFPVSSQYEKEKLSLFACVPVVVVRQDYVRGDYLEKYLGFCDGIKIAMKTPSQVHEFSVEVGNDVVYGFVK